MIRAELIRRRILPFFRQLGGSPEHDHGRPAIRGANAVHELGHKTGGTAFGRLAVIHAFAKKIELPKRIDQALHFFKKHLPYHESDHDLNIAYNTLCSCVTPSTELCRKKVSPGIDFAEHNSRRFTHNEPWHK